MRYTNEKSVVTAEDTELDTPGKVSFIGFQENSWKES